MAEQCGKEGVIINPPADSIEITENGTYPIGYIDEVVVNVSGGGGGDSVGDVNFVDYNGSVVKSYTAQEFAELTAMPDNPNHTADGLVSEGWNWDLEDAQEYVATYGMLNIGQLYNTSDEATKIYIELDENLSPYLGIAVNGTAEIDWGDGSTTETITGSGDNVNYTQFKQHTYSEGGEYVISVSLTNGSLGINGNSNKVVLLSAINSVNTNDTIYARAIKGVHLGSNAKIGYYTFTGCSNLEFCTAPNGTVIETTRTFNFTKLGGFVFPANATTSIDEEAFYGCVNLQYVSLPLGITSIGNYAFQRSGIKSLTLPDTVGSVSVYCCGTCTNMETVVIPSSVTSLGNYSWEMNERLTKIVYAPQNTTAGQGVHAANYSLKKIALQEGVTVIPPYGFSQCISLEEVILPSTLTTISTYAFNEDFNLKEITIPAGVTTIGGQAFYKCCGLSEVHVLPTTPPSAGSNIFHMMPTTTPIYVPSGTLATYQSASGWSTYASQMVEE